MEIKISNVKGVCSALFCPHLPSVVISNRNSAVLNVEKSSNITVCNSELSLPGNIAIQAYFETGCFVFYLSVNVFTDLQNTI